MRSILPRPQPEAAAGNLLAVSPTQPHPATLSDVAAHAGVSVATASRVLNGSQHRVSQRLVEKVRRVAAELRYAPNVQAQGLARSTSSVVALLLHDVADPYFAQLAKGVLAGAGDHDVPVVIGETGNDPDGERAQLDALSGFRPQAVIVAGSRTGHAEAESRLSTALRKWRDSGATVVGIGQPGLPGACVAPRNWEGAKTLAEHLTSLGHRKITVVAGPADLRVVAERQHGFAAGLPEDSTVDVIDSEFTREGGYQAGQVFTQRAAGATAVFVTSDVMAGGFCTALREAGMVIPADVSVAGFDDVPLAADLHPPLTTVRLPLSDMGSSAMALALQGAESETILVEGELVVRDSTKALRDAR